MWRQKGQTGAYRADAVWQINFRRLECDKLISVEFISKQSTVVTQYFWWLMAENNVITPLIAVDDRDIDGQIFELSSTFN